MWAQGNQWNQMSLDAASYQDVNHEHVDWASLAQQWIQMKEVHETVVLNVPSNNHMQFHPPPNSFPTDSGVVGGEAPMDVEKEDEHPPAPPTGLDWSWPVQQPQMPSWPRQFNPFAPRPPFLHGLAPAPPNISQNFIPGGIPHQFQPRMPLLPMPLARQGSSDDDNNIGYAGPQSMAALDAAKRKNLPAWIRGGLEKMEREKQKKEEREKFLEEREQMRKMRLEAQQRNNPSSSRFDDDNEEDSEPEQVEQNGDQEEEEEEEVERPSFSLKPTENLVDMMSVIRKLMTEILLEVTTEEIRSASFEVHQQSKVKSRPAPQSSLPSKSLTQKLGLDQYGSDSDESDDEEGKSAVIEIPKLDVKVLPDGKVEAKQEVAEGTSVNSGSGIVMVSSNNTDSSGMICSTSGTKVEKSDNSNKTSNGSKKKEESSDRRRSRSRSRRRSRSREKSRSSTKKRSRSRDRKRSRSRSRRSRSRSRSRRSSRRSRSRDRRSRRSRSRSKDRRKR